ncbi:MAG: tRNA 2-thiouridine(34) synthase MnmA [Magnetococcales bacterium]|nr:tRNA 2-thiouridine(34) synthase MnmA [Magnetococcales bacterium]
MEQPHKKRVTVAMSGGVDSSVAAACLLEQGYEVIGLTMRLWSEEGGTRARRACCATEDVYDARRVAQTLGIPFFVVDLEAEFRAAVVADFVTTYAAGQTPNPCIRCNQILKFEHLLRKSHELQAEFLATGHYALRTEGPSGPQLWRGQDRQKDQSYFLFTVTSDQLRHLRFPLGDLTKGQTRALAERFGLHLAHKGESQDLCFVPDGDTAAFLARMGAGWFQPGPIVNLAGQVVGKHDGVGGYTIGQRKGLGIASATPLYVVAIEAAHHRLVVGPESALWRSMLQVREINWLGDEPLLAPMRVGARIRYAAEAQPGWLRSTGAGCAKMVFDTPQRAIAPGQACVFYAAERVLGGGWIEPFEVGE